MSRIDFLSLWDQLRSRLEERTSWGKNQILTLMNELERSAVRETVKPKLKPQILYACGYEIREGEFSMFAGPSPYLKEMLSIEPDDIDLSAVLVKFDNTISENEPETTIIYRHCYGLGWITA